MTVVQTSEEEPTLAVARFIAELAWSDAGEEVAGNEITQFCLEAEQLLAAGRNASLVDLLLTSKETILANCSEKEIDCIFAVVNSLVAKVENPEEEKAIADIVTLALLANPAEKAALKLKLLFHLYNVIRDPYLKFKTYMKALDFTAAGKIPDLIVPSFKKIDSFVKDWSIGIEDQRSLFLAITSVLRDSKSASKDSFAFLVRYLATFADSDQRQLASPEIRENAAKATIDFIKAPDVFHCDLLEMKAVRQLENDQKYGVVFQLLTIFLTERLDSYLNFHAKNGAALQSFGLVHEDCVAKMQLMSLAALAAASTTREIPYSLIRSMLKIDESEVELWVVKAIAAKLLEGRMDQLREVVIVNRCTQRVFGATQWRELRANLATWKDNIGRVIAQVRQTRTSGNPMPRGMPSQSVY